MSIDFKGELLYYDANGKAHDCIYLGSYFCNATKRDYALVASRGATIILDQYTGKTLEPKIGVNFDCSYLKYTVRTGTVENKPKKWSIAYTTSSNGRIKQTCFIYDSLEDAENHHDSIDGFVIGYTKEDSPNFVSFK